MNSTRESLALFRLESLKSISKRSVSLTLSMNHHLSQPRRRIQGLYLPLVVCMLALAWWLRGPLHHLPLERDEGAYAVIATRWLAGDVPYRDLFDHKPPLIYVIYALARLVPADPVGAI